MNDQRTMETVPPYGPAVNQQRVVELGESLASPPAARDAPRCYSELSEVAHPHSSELDSVCGLLGSRLGMTGGV
jgi:hypothetical protein